MSSRDEKERNVGGETVVKQNRRKLHTVQMRAVGFHARVFFSHYLKKASEVEEETEVLIKMKDCNNSLLLLL